MGTSDAGEMQLAHRLAGLEAHYLVTDVGRTPDCLPREALAALARQAPAAAGEAERAHIRICPRCSSVLASLRSVHCVQRLPSRWPVPLKGVRFPAPGPGEFPLQVLGRINLASGRFEACEDECDWISHPLTMRVTILLHPETALLTAAVLDVPPEVEAVALTMPEGPVALERDEDAEAYELFLPLADGAPGPQAATAVERLSDFLEAGRAELVFSVRRLPPAGVGSPGPVDMVGLLKRVGAVERAYDYVLPCGRHSDTYVNVGKLCAAEAPLQAVAAALHGLFSDVDFDTVVTNGWAMATVARRLAALRPGRTPVREVLCEGYAPPIPAEDIEPGSRVLVLVDLVVSGTLLTRLHTLVRSFGAVVVAAGCLVDAAAEGNSDTPPYRSLCSIAMRIDDEKHCRRCGVRERREFNPFANCMTEKASYARSPSQFIARHPEVLEFWEFVNTADAYEHHRIERGCHYTAFVDTAKLLAHPEVGPAIIKRLRDRLSDARPVPTVLLIPNRARARALAERLAESLGAAGPGDPPPVCVAARQPNRWRLTDAALLRRERVLIVDSAAGYGRTIDHLARLAAEAGAASVGASVVLTRMTDGCTQALAARLDGGFHWLYHLPVRPVVIRGDSGRLCPVCQRKAAVREAAEESGLEAIERWATLLLRTPHGARSTADADRPRRVEQPSLFPLPEPSFLERCRGSVASGVTLHSLHAAMRNGMAPLALPEIRDETIPVKNRAAMLEHLPPGVVEWSRGYLDQDLLHFLATGRRSAIWRASADVLARECQVQWVHHLADILCHARDVRARPMSSFWGSLTCNAYLVVHTDPETRDEIRACIEHLLPAYRNSAAANGLRQILDAIEPHAV